VGGAVLAFVTFGRALLEEARIYRWEESNCQVTVSEVLRDESRSSKEPYSLKIEFSYAHGGRQYTADTYTRAPQRFARYSAAQQEAERYPRDAAVKCWINPENAAQAVLARKSLWNALVLIVPLALALFGLIPLAIACAPSSGRAEEPKALSVEADQKERAGRKGALAVRVFCGIFFLVGTGVFYPFCLKPGLEMLDSQGWQPAACRVISSRVAQHEGDGDSPGYTYSIDILYSYSVNGTEYRSDRYEIFSASSSGYRGKRAVVDQYPAGRDFTCYYDPKQPSRAVIRPGFSWNVLLGLIPLAFMVVGLMGMLYGGRTPAAASGAQRFFGEGGRSVSGGASLGRREGALSAGSSSEKKLEPQFGPSAKLGCAAVAVLVLTAILLFVYFDEIRRGSIGWGILFNPFVLIDALLIGVGLPYFYLASFNPRPVLILSPGEPVVGESFTVSWRLSGSTQRLRRLKLTMVGTEEAEYSRGTDTSRDRSVFYEQIVRETKSPGELPGGSVSIRIRWRRIRCAR
jgi:hypothetical protein